MSFILFFTKMFGCVFVPVFIASSFLFHRSILNIFFKLCKLLRKKLHQALVDLQYAVFSA